MRSASCRRFRSQHRCRCGTSVQQRANIRGFAPSAPSAGSLPGSPSARSASSRRRGRCRWLALHRCYLGGLLPDTVGDSAARWQHSAAPRRALGPRCAGAAARSAVRTVRDREHRAQRAEPVLQRLRRTVPDGAAHSAPGDAADVGTGDRSRRADAAAARVSTHRRATGAAAGRRCLGRALPAVRDRQRPQPGRDLRPQPACTAWCMAASMSPGN